MRPNIEWVVEFCKENLQFDCSCKRFQTLGIACKHLLSVLIYMNIVDIPASLLLKRWNKSAKDEVNACNGNSASMRDLTFSTTYITFVECCKRMVNATLKCGSQEHLRSTIEMVKKPTNALEAVGGSEVGLNRDISILEQRSLGNLPCIRKGSGVCASTSKQAQMIEKIKEEKY